MLDYNAHANTYFEKMSDEDKKQWIRDRDDKVGPLVRVPWYEQVRVKIFTALRSLRLGSGLQCFLLSVNPVGPTDA